MDYSIILKYFLTIINDNLILSSILVPIIGGGEIGIITLSLLFSKSLINYLIILFFCAIGMTLVDSIWFLVVRFKLVKKISYNLVNNLRYKFIERKLENFFGNSDFLTILIMKVMAGTRILFIFYISNRKISFKKYFILITIVNLTWSFVLTTIGYLANKGYTYLISLFNNFIIGVTFLISLSLVLYVCQEIIKNKFLLEKKI